MIPWYVPAGFCAVLALGWWLWSLHARAVAKAAASAVDEYKQDVCSYIARLADSKSLDGDAITSAAFMSAGTNIWNHTIYETIEAMRNQSRAREPRSEDYLTAS